MHSLTGRLANLCISILRRDDIFAASGMDVGLKVVQLSMTTPLLSSSTYCEVYLSRHQMLFWCRKLSYQRWMS